MYGPSHGLFEATPSIAFRYLLVLAGTSAFMRRVLVSLGYYWWSFGTSHKECIFVMKRFSWATKDIMSLSNRFPSFCTSTVTYFYARVNTVVATPNEPRNMDPTGQTLIIWRSVQKRIEFYLWETQCLRLKWCNWGN